MKKNYILLAIMLLWACMANAQTTDVRTNKTIVADILAQLPAKNQEVADKQFADLASTGEEGVAMLIEMLEAAGQNGNASVEYALSGLTTYASLPERESLRQTVVAAYLKGLNKTENAFVKRFLIEQLRQIGKDESVDQLGMLLGVEEFSADAAGALAAIRTDKSVQALRRSLLSRMGTFKTQMNAVQAIGEAALINSEDLLQLLLESPDEGVRRAAYYALGRTGSYVSLAGLAGAAAKAGYKYEKTGATAAYIELIRRVGEQGSTKEALKAATDLHKAATKAGLNSVRIAANGLLFDIQPEETTKLLLASLKDKDREYRNAALTFASPRADAAMYVAAVKQMAKARTDVKVDILDWIGREAADSKKNTVLKGLEIRFDLPARQVLVNQLKDASLDVKASAARALAMIGDKQSVPVLADLLANADKEVVKIGKNALEYFPGDIDQAVAKVIPQAKDFGKEAGLQLLAARKAESNKNTVYNQLDSSSPVVKKAAGEALKEVVNENDFVRLCGLLETDGADTKYLQQAIISALSSLPPDKQVATLNSRILQAGPDKKHLYYTALAATGDPKALAIVGEGFAKGTDVAKKQAFEALLQWNGPQAADGLYAICTDASAADYFEQALVAYVRLATTPALKAENRLLRLRKAMEIARTDEQKNAILRQIGRTETFLAMLYAGEFLDEKPLQQTAAQAVMNIALEHKEYTGTLVRNLLTKTSAVLDNPDAGYQREAIRKHLAEMPEEEGFVSLFNGKDLTGWKGLVGNPLTRAKMTAKQLEAAQKKADEQMRKDWKAENGCLVFDGTGYDNLCTVKQYGDIEMYIDWMLDTSGKEADAGIYLRGTPQVQMWDTARVNVGAQVGSGGLYNNKTHASKPLKVADNKMGEWNTFYIRMVGDRVTVVLNGETVTDDVILENYWDRKSPIFHVEQLELQAHGSKVYYRNVYVKELPRTEPFRLSDQEKKEGYQILFDGTNMHEWTGNTVDYTMDDGTISLVPSRGSGGNLYTRKEYGNFIFRFEFQLTPAANNGLGIRTPMEGDPAYVGMELQILDNEHPVYKDLEDYQYHGSVYGVIPAKRGYLKPLGEWNYQEVIANGDHIKITLNGHVILDGNIREASKNGTIDKTEHPGLFNKKGYIGFLGHGSPVKFRNIRIKELK